VASTLGIERESIFAIGDSHNDLEMLDVRIAAMVACPANAVAEIKEHLRAQDGYLSTAAYSAGVCEALRNFFF
jgi:hydroxymethylpyrimidine pyrophosphatase-like HAD family hydrolase